MSLENIENSAKNIVELSYEYERTKDKIKSNELKKRIIQLSTNIKKMIKEESGKS